MTVREWFEANKVDDPEVGPIAYLIQAEGRGEAYIEALDDGQYGASITDTQLAQSLQKPGEFEGSFSKRQMSEIKSAIFSGEDDIEKAVRWFVDQVSYSVEDREALIRKWKGLPS